MGRGPEQDHDRLPRGIPQRKGIEKRITELWNYEKYTAAAKVGGRYFYRKNDGLQNQSVLYTMDRLDGEPRVLIDPNTWSKDGTIALGGTAVSPDARYLAYGVSDAGSDWETWKVLDVDTGQAARRRAEVGQVLRRIVDRGRQGLLLQPVRRAEAGRDVPVGQPEPEGLLPPRRHAAGGGRARLQAAGPPGLGLPGRRRPTTAATWSSPPGRGPTTATASPTATWPSRSAMPVDLIDHFDNDYTFIDNDGPVFYFRTDLEGAERPGHRHRHSQAGPGALEGDHPGGEGQARRR